MRKKESTVEFFQESSEKNLKNCGKQKWKSNKLEEEVKEEVQIWKKGEE